MNIAPVPKLLTLCIASLLLSSCGGGSGGGMLRTPAPSAPPPAPAPPPPAPPGPSVNLTLCPLPLTSDCIVTLANGAHENLPAIQASHALIVRAGTGRLGLVANTYRFDGGTRVETGQLGVGFGANFSSDKVELQSNVEVAPAGSLFVVGTVRGDVTNHGWLDLVGSIRGNVVNGGTVSVNSPVYGNAMAIFGDFTSSSAGTLAFALAPAGWDSPAPLQVSGRANLNGTLQLGQYSDAWGPYPLPATGAQHILHADGGVIGQFARWTAPGLFVEGAPRYGNNDVWFDLTRISLAAATASNGIGGAVTLASAVNLDRAFARADVFAVAPSSAQQRFLQSAAHVAWLADPGQAQRSLDSLAGSLHVDALQRARAQVDPSAVNMRLARVLPGHAAGAWSQPTLHGAIAGFDRWLEPGLLLGFSAGIQDAGLGGDRLNGQARSQAPRVDAYLRWYGERGWYAGGSAGFAHHALTMDRSIDLGRGGRWNAHSQRTLDLAHVQAEAGRTMQVGAGRLAPYAGLDVTALRSDRFMELGYTGFELALQPALQAELAGRLGLRYARDWRTGERGWLRLDADAHARRRLAQAGDPLRAAFLGVPDTWFDVPGVGHAGSAALRLGLRGGLGPLWNWSLDYARYLGGGNADGSAVASLRRDF